jgi:hypothetical protein
MQASYSKRLASILLASTFPQNQKLAYKQYVESEEQKNAKINGLEGQTVQNKE